MDRRFSRVGGWLWLSASLAVPLAPAGAQTAGQQVLLVPNSLRDSISVCDAAGELLSLYYIYLPVDPSAPSPQPIQIVPSGRGTLIVADEGTDQVVEMTAQGEVVRVLAGPQHGVHNAYSVCVSGGVAYFTAPRVAETDPDLIWRVPVDGSAPPTVFFDFAPLGTPRGIIRVQAAGFDGFYVGDSIGDDIERITIGRTAIAPFHDSDGITGIDFPQQLVLQPDGTLLAAGFSMPAGIYRFSVGGSQISYAQLVSPRGVHLLPSGEYMYSSGVNLRAFDPATGIDRFIYSGTTVDSFRFITPWQVPSACPADLDASGNVDGVDLARVLAEWGNPGSADVDGDGTVSGTDLTYVLSAWGPC